MFFFITERGSSVYMQLCCSLQTEVQYANQLKQLQEIFFGTEIVS